jgi:hypothetical protein
MHRDIFAYKDQQDALFLLIYLINHPLHVSSSGGILLYVHHMVFTVHLR